MTQLSTKTPVRVYELGMQALWYASTTLDLLYFERPFNYAYDASETGGECFRGRPGVQPSNNRKLPDVPLILTLGAHLQQVWWDPLDRSQLVALPSWKKPLHSDSGLIREARPPDPLAESPPTLVARLPRSQRQTTPH